MKNTRRKDNSRKYFDTFEYDRLCKMINYDIYAAKEGFESYLIRYNDDLTAHVKYAQILTTIGEFKEAEKRLIAVENRIPRTSFYVSDDARRTSLTKFITFNKARIYAFQGKTWPALITMYNHKDIFEGLTNAEVFYLRKIVGNLNKDINREDLSYIHRQILEYKEEDLIDHIKKHEADFNMNDKEISQSFFVPDFPIEKVIEEVKNNMKKENRLYDGFYDNTYTFKYNGCGRSSDKMCDFFEVVTFNRTKDIITMYPTTHTNNSNYVDLSHLNEKEEAPKVKMISQIEKFNKRYYR